MNMKKIFNSYKSIESYIRKRTEKDFFMCGSSSHRWFNVIVSRNGSLDILKDTFNQYYYTEKHADRLVEFIETGKRYE